MDTKRLAIIAALAVCYAAPQGGMMRGPAE
jgi:hypothetical protein